MTFNPKISVIIPCYKVEIFLPTIVKCLEQQTFQDFEIIFVNDGGGQSQLQIMEQCKAKNDKIRIIDKVNGGVSSARNAGIDEARGEYICFVDADDEIEPYYLSSLYTKAREGESDIVIGGFKQVYVKENRILKIHINTVPLQKWDVFLQNSFLYGAVWNKIFKTDFIKSNHFYFPVYISFSEDRFFINNIITEANPDIAYIKDCGYIYKMNDNQSASSTFHRQYTQNKLMLLDSEKRIIKWFDWNEEITDKYFTNYIYLMGYFICCNYFKQGTTMSFTEQMDAIQRELLQNEKIMQANKKHDKSKNNLFLKIYDICIKTKSPFLIALTFKLQYFMKYNLYGVYLKFAPYLRGVKKI
jgi:glycosyltransferase involved in cell wall biosynthesis